MDRIQMENKILDLGSRQFYFGHFKMQTYAIYKYHTHIVTCMQA